ncbi:MAG: 50S ribosomal protein L10 [Candidatus Altiarchaeales archaeon]|nr:50S ribosomal protein L10 [Candidatus Altiarchaeales archaeon]MBD3416700.1 50S ribosomal protein L10 [Candidatus Altiarchaeales archaeon]
MVAPWKKDMVKEAAKRIKSRKVVGVVKISGVPSKQMQDMRKKLKGDADIIVSRSTILKRALEKAGVKGLEEYLKGPSGLILSDLNPFQLEKLLYSNRSKAPAKPGNIAPYDLTVPEGDTGLPAGPVIGDLQGAGVKAKIQGGKIMVTEDSLLVNGGDPVNEKVATVLARLGIEPMEIMLKLNAAHEDGTVYSGDVLHIDEAETLARFQDAHRKAFNLSYHARIFNKHVVEVLLTEAVCNARNLMVNAEIINKDTIELFLGKADAHAKALRSALPPEAFDGKKEEAPVDGKKEDAPAEEKETAAEEKKEEALAEDKKEDKPAEEKKDESPDADEKPDPPEEKPAEPEKKDE